jgi:DNA-binding transcriptional LysR family regulator
MVNLELFKIFYTVAKCGSLTKASEELFISQPAVSQAIKQLEIQIGAKLFVRTNKGMELSDQGGKQIYPLVESAIKLLESAESKVSEIKDTASGVIRICASDTVSTHFLLPYVRKYHEKYPNVNLVFKNCTSSETIDNIKNGKGELGFVNLPISDTGVVLSDKVMALNDVFVAGEKYLALKGKVVPLKTLQEYPLLMLESSTVTRRTLTEFASSQGVQLQPEIELASLELMTKLAVLGMGIACVPREFVSEELVSGKLFEIQTTPSVPSRAIGLVLPKDTERTFAVKEFIKILGDRE